MSKPLPQYPDTMTAWGAGKGKAQNVRQPEPCRSCGHHPGDHKGYSGQLEARCIFGCLLCFGYRDWGPKLAKGSWTYLMDEPR